LKIAGKMGENLYENCSELRETHFLPNMSTKQLCNSLIRFSKCGTLEDLSALNLQLASRVDASDFSLHLDLRVVLKVGERCVFLQEGLLMPEWGPFFCLSFFLCGINYAGAQAFAKSFLTSDVGRRAFIISAQCMTRCTDPNSDLLYHALQFLSSALWHESQMVYVLRTHPETYRMAFAGLARCAAVLGSNLRSVAPKLFHNILFGRLERPTDVSHFKDELMEALTYFVAYGGLTAFSAMFWAICNRMDLTTPPENIRNMSLYFNKITASLMQSELAESEQQVVSQWLATEAVSKTGIVAGFYATFASVDELYRIFESRFL
jgi:hypothetical protein